MVGSVSDLHLIVVKGREPKARKIDPKRDGIAELPLARETIAKVQQGGRIDDPGVIESEAFGPDQQAPAAETDRRHRAGARNGIESISSTGQQAGTGKSAEDAVIR